ncbi:MAG: S8/S53 family peptidase [Duganella sp.]
MPLRTHLPTICLIDTGLTPGDYAPGVIAGGINLSGCGEPQSLAPAGSRHGDAMAGTLLAHCPQARLVNLKLLDENGWLLDAGRLDAAFAWVVAQRAALGITVVCAAVADASHHAHDAPFQETPLSRMIALLRAAGVPTVMPAGNSYPQFRLREPHGMAWPAILRDVVSVAALDAADPQRLHRYSQRLPALAGAACATTLHLVPGPPGQTSGAAAVAAGRLAQLRAAFPDADVSALVALLRADAWQTLPP